MSETRQEENAMLELLRRWAELEPEQCRAGGVGFWLAFPDTKEPLFYRDGDTDMLGWMQWIVQRLVERRGWRWNGSWHPKDQNLGIPAHWGFTVVAFDGVAHVRNSHESASAALLLAYLDALEARDE